MVFPRFLRTDETTLDILKHFKWDRRQDLCPNFELSAIQEAAWDFFLVKIPQVVFYVMLLNDAVKLVVLRGGMIEIPESALMELRWSTFEEWVWRNRDNIPRAPYPETNSNREESSGSGKASPPPCNSVIFSIMVFPHFLSTEEMADHGAAHPPRPLPKNYHDLCLGFNLSDTKEATRNFRIPKMVRAVSYAIVVNEAFEMGVLSRDLAEHLKSSLKGLQWYMYEAWLQLDKHTLLWAQYHAQVNPGAGPKPMNGKEQNSASSDAPPPSSDDE
ncbi:hypothetical protein Cgig2_023223 [Carnegiea gigantea]|uniref:Uncharacterized protein n=1 Tax=Carnegiea gigantea TaxID=171969 RepID=A0A9Q1GGT6_9CARY|nr:hypothetical protein Cgig2_023223 [Carnegiea gigantea]